MAIINIAENGVTPEGMKQDRALPFPYRRINGFITKFHKISALQKIPTKSNLKPPH